MYISCGIHTSTVWLRYELNTEIKNKSKIQKVWGLENSGPLGARETESLKSLKKKKNKKKTWRTL